MASDRNADHRAYQLTARATFALACFGLVVALLALVAGHEDLLAIGMFVGTAAVLWAAITATAD